MTGVAYLTMWAGLVFWSLVPVLLGWTPGIVVSGSMSPAIDPGDVLVSSPVRPTTLRRGQIVVVHRDGRAVSHRVVRLLDDGRVVTRGDANQSEDPVAVDPDGVRGLDRLVIPYVGRPALAAREGRYPAVLAWLASFAAAAWLASGRQGRHRPTAEAGRERPCGSWWRRSSRPG
ncbi:signal peptidase I [Spirillospora sp. CA-253888]